MTKLMNVIAIADATIEGVTGLRNDRQEEENKIDHMVSVLSQKTTLGVKRVIGEEIDRSINNMMDLPNEIKDELRRTTSHEGVGRVFKPQLNQYDYFGAYYQQQQQRYQTPTQPNLAELLCRQENIIRGNRRL